jgi:hypothetical protein
MIDLTKDLTWGHYVGSNFNNHGVILPVPDNFVCEYAYVWHYFSFSLAGVFVLWIIYRAVKYGDYVPGLLFIGGLVASYAEPMYDNIAHLWYARNLPGPLITAFGIPVPYLAAPVYAVYLSIFGFFFAKLIHRGITKKKVWMFFVFMIFFNLVMEYPGLWTGAYMYWGQQPTEIFGFPLHWGWINSLACIVIGFFVWLAEKARLNGLHKLLFVVITLIGHPTAAAAVGWPIFLALNMDISLSAAYALEACSLVLTLTLIEIIATIASGKPFEKIAN